MPGGGGTLRHVPADHGPHQIVAGQAGKVAGEHVPAVPHHSDPLADLEDLLQPVRDEKHRRAARAQRTHHLEQPGDLGRGQGGGRLVHHDHPRVQGQRLGDLHDLLVRDGQAAADPARVEPDAQPLEKRGGLAAHQLSVDPPGGPQRLAAHEDVLRDREIGEEGGLLVDDGDAGVPGRCRAVQGDRRAADEQLTLIRRVHPGEHLHHGRLARAVLTKQRVRLPRVQVGGSVHHGVHRAERLRRVPSLLSRRS